MDAKLWAWGRQIKVQPSGRPLNRLPRLWLYTDAQRLPNPLAVIDCLPRGKCGVVFRHDSDPGRLALGQSVARLCRQRRLALSVSGDWRLAARLGAGLHLRGGRAPAHAPRSIARLTASAHDALQVRRARAGAAALIFISPIFSSSSHPERSALGPRRWATLARGLGCRAAALGGIGGRRVAGLPERCRAAGAIAGFLPN